MSDYTNFIPKRRLISAISNAVFATVTTTEDHGYDEGLVVRLIVPSNYKMTLEWVQARILSVPTDDTFVCDVDTSDMDAFVAPSYPPGYTNAQVVPMSGVELNNITITG